MLEKRFEQERIFKGKKVQTLTDRAVLFPGRILLNFLHVF